MRDVFGSGERMVLVTMACALVCVFLSILAGAVGALSYIPGVGAAMASVGFSLVQLRPLHTTFASAWIYLGCVACIYAYLVHTYGALTEGERRRFKIHMVCWGVAGLGALVTLPFGITSGREYLGFHPVFSILIVVGWVCFLWTFLGRIRHGFWRRPVYVYMWTSGALFFVYTFVEGHAYLLPFVKSHPVADLQIQWKSCGTLVAAFNQMVYGTLVYIGERSTGDKSIGQSRSAFALFGVGLLNSFTNYAHHTYHLPQDNAIKWIAFLVSMLEIVIVWNMLREVVAKSERMRPLYSNFSTSTRLLTLSKNWNMLLLPVAILISVPQLNSVIHGTHVVMAHAMGSELAIDTYILLGAFSFLLTQYYPKREVIEGVIDGPAMQRNVFVLNIALVVVFATLLLRGLTVGITRYLGEPVPVWIDEVFPIVFVVSGLTLGLALVRLILCWVPLFREARAHKLYRDWVADPSG
ncbi:MAG: hypothetical protein ACYTGZ_17150 [Planctomycetota bacterium]|jgi:nitric oxide reductase subunit B